MGKRFFAFLLGVCICVASTFAIADVYNPWKKVETPTSSAPESIGDYSAGCHRGAQWLPDTGPGFQVMRLSRKRFFGHPALLDFLVNLGSMVKLQTGQSILVGDMGQPRGGPTFSGHASHQTGLDVDIWFYLPPAGKILTLQERESTGAPSMVVPEMEALTTQWSDSKILLLQAAAENENVERIFVNPPIKARVCGVMKQGNLSAPAWVRKLRPWWFHEEHFHVRLKCQPGSPGCQSQNPPPPGDGCGEELQSWLTPETKRKQHDMRISKPTAPVMPSLPAECSRVLQESAI